MTDLPKIGETWSVNLQGKTRWATGGSDAVGPVVISWVSTDGRVYEGTARKGKQSEKVTFSASLLVARVSEKPRW